MPRSTSTPVWSQLRLRRTPAAPDERRSPELVNVEFVFTRPELQPVLAAIRTALECGAVPMDSPQLLQDALRTLVRNLDGRAGVSVRRSPAALLTPEYWQIVLVDVDTTTHAALRELFSEGRP